MMRALASSTAVAVLLLSLAAVSGDDPVVYEDECNYEETNYYKCGDKCLKWNSLCNCGGDTLVIERSPTHHCCPDAPCTQSVSGGDVTCEGGKVLYIDTPCQGVCYADIEKSKWLNLYRSRYTCRGRHTECLKVTNMCQGLCNAETCNKTLRCDEIN